MNSGSSGRPILNPTRRWSIGIVITIVLGLAPAIVAVRELNGHEGDGHPSSTGSTTTTSASGGDPGVTPSILLPSNPSPTPNKTPSCLILGQAVSCQAEHDSEVISELRSCSEDQLLDFMGGRADVDVLREGLTIKQQGDRCLVDGISASTTQSLEGVLATPSGDSYRICWNRATNRNVGCDVAHDAELIYQGSAEITDCKEQYLAYVGRSYDRDGTKLLLRTAFNTGTRNSCWAEVRSENRLDKSIRNLKDNALPIQSVN